MFYKTKEGELYPVKMILVLINKIKNKIINERYLVILSLLISLSLSFLISVILHSNSNSPYSIKDLIKSTAIISIFILIISCVLVMNRKQIINDFVAKEILPFVKNILNEKSSWLAVVLFLLALGILILIIIPNGITYNRPQFSYGVKIEPVENFDSVLCIKSISNNYGDILRYNETVKNLNITGNWKHNVDGCSLFLESGEKGIISFQNIGSVQDKLNIVLLNSAKTGVLKVTSNPGKIKFIDLKLEKNYLYNTNYKLGSVLTRNLTDCGVTIGVLSCVIFLILVFSNQIPKMNRKILNQRFVADKLQSLKSFITKSWEAFDRENMAILALLALYILGVIFTIKVINPMSFGPSHFKDEVTYWNASRSIFNGQFSTKQYHYPPPISNFYITCFLSFQAY